LKKSIPTNKLLFHKTHMLRDIIVIYNKSQTNLKTQVVFPMYIMNMFSFCLLINGFMFQCFHEPLITCTAMTQVTQFILQKKTTSKTKKATHYKVHIKDTSSIWWNNAIVLFNLHNMEECNSRLTLSAIGLQCMQNLCNFKPKIGFFGPTINK
jgi:hypothetical protein